MNELLVKANEEVKKVVEYLRENEEMFDMMDLKLHDIDGYRWKDMEKDFPLCYKDDSACSDGYDTFYYFCDDNYNAFIKDLKEFHNIDFSKIRKSVGRTSSFYLADFIETTHCKIDIKDTLNNLLCDCVTLNYTDITDDFEIKPYGDYTEEDEEVIEELEEISGFYDWFIYKIEDIKIVYDYIKDFKNNQVEYYKEYLESEEERLQEIIDEQKSKKEKSKDVVNQVKIKYNISEMDMKILKDNM